MRNERLIGLLERDNTNDNDNERKAMFTIFAGNDELYSKIDDLYDFEERGININAFEEVDLSSGTYQLVKLAFNLYAYQNEANVAEVFRNLDDENYKLAKKAIDVRFNRA